MGGVLKNGSGVLGTGSKYPLMFLVGKVHGFHAKNRKVKYK